MNQNLSRQKLVIGGVAVAAALLAMITFVGQQNQRKALTPEGVVEVIYRHCKLKEYALAAVYFDGGPSTDHAMSVSVCEKVTEGRRVMEYLTDVKHAGEDRFILETQNNLEGPFPGRQLKWTLVKKRGRWLVAEVV